MKSILTTLIAVFLISVSLLAQDKPKINDNFAISKVSVKHIPDLGVTVWAISVMGRAGETTPQQAGQLDGAPVFGYVFPTSLNPTDVGFNETEGILALALTSHPDFDDTPLWDENSDRIYDNDGIIWHPHWVVLVEDKRIDGGLSVKQFVKADDTVVLPLTNPGMPMYMDSPGFPVTVNNKSISVVVPDYRMNNRTDFNYDGVSVFMKVNTSNEDLPMLGVYEVFSIASGDLSLPYKVR